MYFSEVFSVVRLGPDIMLVEFAVGPWRKLACAGQLLQIWRGLRTGMELNWLRLFRLEIYFIYLVIIPTFVAIADVICNVFFL